jgi:hypothetical protein
VGLELKETKTRITHTDISHKEQTGFDFLGFNVRRYPVGHNSRNKFGANRKTIIKPRKKAIKSHYEDLITKINNTNKTEVLVTQLNPIIRGWCDYFSTVSSKETFSSANYESDCFTACGPGLGRNILPDLQTGGTIGTFRKAGLKLSLDLKPLKRGWV